MADSRRNTAVVLAGGVGTRLGDRVPKQLLPLAGRPVIDHAIAALDGHSEVDEVLVVMVPGHLDAVRRIVLERGFGKVGSVIEGGSTRTETVARALAALVGDGGAERKVLLHDAVRPLVTSRVVSDCYAALDDSAAVTAAIPTSDTVVQVDESGTVRAAPPRSSLRRVQTPQGFLLSVIVDVHERAARDPRAPEATDDCSLVLRYRPEVPVRVVDGDERNLKITHRADLVVAEALLRDLHA